MCPISAACRSARSPGCRWPIGCPWILGDIKRKTREEFLSHRAHDARARARARAHFAVASAPRPDGVSRRRGQSRITGGWRVEGVPIALSVLACSRIDPGISHEKAEAILRAFDFTDIELPPSPEGWSGTAVPASGGYRIRATLPDGVLKPFRSYLR